MDNNSLQNLKFFLSLDFDDAGQVIGQSILHDDIEGLMHQSHLINAGQNHIIDWAEGNGGTIISSGGDESFIGFPHEIDMEAIESMRNEVGGMVGATATIGLGSAPSEAGKALLFGKLNGKNQVVHYSPEIDEHLMEAHQRVASGEGSAEEVKQDEHYLDDVYGDDEAHSDEFEDQDHNYDDYEEGMDPSDYDQYDESQDADYEPQYDEHTSEDQDDFEDQPEEMGQEFTDIVDDAGVEEGSEEGSEIKDAMKDEFEDQPEEMVDETMIEEDPSQAPMEPQTESAGLKQKLGEVLESFKTDKDSLERLSTENPELYSQVIMLLQQMIGVAKAMNSSEPATEAPIDQQVNVAGDAVGKQNP